MISLAGTLVADIMARPISDWPKKGSVVSIEEIEIQPGGAVANTGQILERLGVSVSAHAAVGDDNLGQMIKGLVGTWATRPVVQVLTGHRTTASVVAVAKNGDRSFINAPGACDQFRLTEAQIEEDVRLGARAFHLGYALVLPAFDGDAMKRAFRRARELGALTSLDVTYCDSPRWPTLVGLMPEVDVFCPSLSEAEAITGKSGAASAAEALEQAGVKQFIAVTNGARGAIVRIPGKGEEKFPALPAKAIDTTGAGDAFIAAVLAAWYRGLDWKTAARAGIAAGSLAVTSGNRYKNLRSWTQVEALVGAVME
jgi:sugar/nucleoside kinase (ribokinase family)